MNKEKQIEDMALALSEGGCGKKCDCSEGDKFNCHLLYSASVLYKEGYRKQEWISVEDRLPETETPVLIFTKQKRCYVGYYYKAAVNQKFTGFYSDSCKRDVTHWMYLPEPPKGE